MFFTIDTFITVLYLNCMDLYGIFIVIDDFEFMVKIAHQFVEDN